MLLVDRADNETHSHAMVLDTKHIALLYYGSSETGKRDKKYILGSFALTIALCKDRAEEFCVP